MSLSRGQLAQMEAAALHRQEDKEHLLLEQEIMGKWARGELVPVIRCKDCIYWDDSPCSTAGHRRCKMTGRVTLDDQYCDRAVRKEKTDG